MNRPALDPTYRRMTVDEFLRIEFPDAKAELIDGCIYMMAGAEGRHNFVAGNIFGNLFAKLRGSGCLPYNSDQAVRTGPDTVRYPDVSVYCGSGPSNPEPGLVLLGVPKVIFEVLSPSTKDNDQRFKLPEYLAIPGVEAVVLADPESERVRLVTKEGGGDWLAAGADLPLDCLGVTLAHAEIFGRD